MPTAGTGTPGVIDFVGWVMLVMAFFFPITLAVMGVACILACTQKGTFHESLTPPSIWQPALTVSSVAIIGLQFVWASYYCRASTMTRSPPWQVAVPVALFVLQVCVGVTFVVRARRRRLAGGLVLAQLYVGLLACYAATISVTGSCVSMMHE
jgi:hypothetical protein